MGPQYGATDVREVTVDGFAGKDFQMLGAPDDLDRTRCSAASYRPWAGRWWMGPTEINRVRVLDVGGERVVMRAVYFEGTPEEDVAALFRMLDSVRIEIETPSD